MWSVVQGTKRLIFSVILILILGIGQWINCTNTDINCGHPAIPVNAELTLNSTKLTPWTIATYKCKDGFELFGNTILTCSTSGKWKGELPFCGTNVAYRKPANQSTTVRGGSAQNANSGRKVTEQDASKCSETQKEASPSWQVDLLRPYSVKVVRVTTKGCCGHQPLQDMEIRVGNSSTQLQRNPLCAWFPGTIDEGVTKAFTCARTLIGQFVFLQLVGVDGSLSLCDVEVFTSDELSLDDCSPKGAPEDLQLSAFNRTCYEFGVSQGKSFKDARAYCKRYNGDLVHSINFATTHFIHTELEQRKGSLKTQLVWIGAEKEAGESKIWKWINGDPIYNPAWGLDQPNNYNGEQNCVVLDGGRGWAWNDVGCNLDYLHWICQYSPVSCGGPDKQLNTTVMGTNYNVGSMIDYKCPEGYLLLGDATRKCTKQGLWSGSAPSCKYVNCKNLDSIEHGSIALQDDRTTYGARAIYSCHNNYTLVGQPARSCGIDGSWTNFAPKCLFTWCNEPPAIEGGIVDVSGNKAGDTAVYTCQPGFMTIGKSVLTCEFGGKWSGKVPICKYVDCGLPPSIYNGKYNLLNTTTFLGSIVEYSCTADYWLDGEKSQRCTSEGKWSSDTPSCELITCVEPDVPAGSYVVGYDFNVHSVIEYNCEPGHILKGESTFTCLRTGEWSGNTPVCEFIDCGKVPSIVYGEVAYTNGTTYLHSEITYKCSKNYRLYGSSKRRCLDTKQWSESLPKCEEIRCPEPILANHSILSVTGNDRMYGRTLIKTETNSASSTTYKVGALVKYRCERGYKIIGESLSSCEDNGYWSGDVPECVYVDCKNPEKIQHGKVTLTSNATYYGAIALYSCELTYELDGISRRICLENGTWGVAPPTCKEIQCKSPDLHNGALITVDTYSAGGIVQYMCPRGHHMHGNATRVCSIQGKWSGSAPSCIPAECPEPIKIENGHVIVTNGTTYNSHIEYHCIPGYKRVGPYLRKCLEEGNWSGEAPNCEKAEEEPQESSSLGKNVGIGSGVVIALLIVLGLIYLKLRKPVPVKNTENVESAERKDDRNASVVSYASLSDRNGTRLPQSIYQNIDDENMYNAPYEETRRGSGSYEPEPIGNFVTINGVSVR